MVDVIHNQYDGETNDDAGGGGIGGWRRKHEAGRRRPQGSSALGLNLCSNYTSL